MHFTSNVKNPWSVKSIYEFQFFNCPSCVYKINSKQAFINHAYEIHPEATNDLNNIQDGSLSDIICPWDDIKKEEIDAMDDFDAVHDNIAEEEDWETSRCFQDDEGALEPSSNRKRTSKTAIKKEESNFENIECKVDIKSEESIWKRGGIKASPCMYCEKILKDSAKIKEHLKTCHPDIEYVPKIWHEARKKAWPCKYCDELCVGKTKLKDHIDEFHSEVHYATTQGPGRPRGSYKIKELIPDNTIPKSRNPDAPHVWQCEDCNKTFKYHSKLLSTIQIYYAQMPLQFFLNFCLLKI